jgi:hypothetical protein
LVDQALLEFVAGKLDVPHDIAHRALLNGTKNDISVAYYILLDSRRQKAPAKIQASPPRELTPQEPKIVSPKSEASTPEGGRKLVASPVMESLVSQKIVVEKQARESYNEPTPKSLTNSPSILTSMLSSTPSQGFWGAASFNRQPGSLGSPAKPTLLGGEPDKLPGQVSDPIGIPKQVGERVGDSPISYPNCCSPASGGYMDGPKSSQGSQNSTHPEQPIPEQLVHNNWRLGLFTELLSNQAMQQIYSVLRSLDFTWKVHSPYHILSKSKGSETEPPISIGIQLYRMHERHDKGYLVDISILGDDVFPCIDKVHQLYSRINSKIGA